MQNEAEVFRKMQKGDWAAFSSFFDAYAEQLCLYASGFISNREEARDIVQDTFVYLWVNRAKLVCSESLYGYLIRTVKNFCIDYKRHEKVRETYGQKVVFTEEDTEEEQEDFDKMYIRLRKIIDDLPPKCREIFILGCVEGHSYNEVAEQLGISVNTVKTQIKVAYKKVKSEIGEENAKFMLLFLPLFQS